MQRQTTLIILVVFTVLGCSTEEAPFTPGYKISLIEENCQWSYIPECISGIGVVYSSGMHVRNRIVARMIFQQLIELNRYSSEKIITWGADHRLERVEPYGTHLGIKYWKVITSFDDNGTRTENSTFLVSEYGDVVVRTGCI